MLTHQLRAAAAFAALMLCLLIFAPKPAFARTKTMIVYDFAGDTADQRSSGRQMAKLLRYELDRQGDVAVRDRPQATCATITCAKSVRRDRGVDAVVIGEVSRMDGRLNVFVRAVWADGVETHRLKLSSTSEFDDQAERLADAIASRNDHGDVMAMDSVSDSELRPYAKKQMGNFNIGAYVGAWAPVANTYLGTDFVTMFSPFVRYDVADFGFEVEWGIWYTNAVDYDTYVTEYPIDVSAMYYFSKRDRSPLIGATFGVNGLALSDKPDFFGSVDSVDYWTPHLAAFVGYEVGRAQRFSFIVRAGYKFDLIDFDEVRETQAGENGAHGVFLQVGATFLRF